MRLMYILVFFFLFACSNGKVEKRNFDSASVSKNINSTDSDVSEADYRHQFIEMYAKQISFDTSFVDKATTYKLLFKHFCTMDSSLVVPTKYNFDIKKDFITHSFKSNLIFLGGNDTLFRKEITKADFDSILYPELKKYAALLYPTLKLENDSIFIHYSISIPVTDVGIGVTIKFDKKGNYAIDNK